MRKRLAVAITTGFLISIAMAIPAISQPNKPIRCQMQFQLDWDNYIWVGTVSGDIEGSIIVTPSSASFPGSTEHFLETWVITTQDGTIEGYDEGVWSFKTFKVRTNGRVTRATDPAWADLVGCKVHFMGSTSEFPVPYPDPVTGTCAMTIQPGSNGK